MTHLKPFVSINWVALRMGVHHLTARSYLATLGLQTIRIGHRDLYRTVEVVPHLQALFGEE